MRFFSSFQPQIVTDTVPGDGPAETRSNAFMTSIRHHRATIKIVSLLVLNGLVFVYFGFATAKYMENGKFPLSIQFI